jgi:single-strand DNA-binding protein
MNAITVSGYLTNDPELLYRQNRPTCTLRIAVKDRKHEPTYIDVRTFDDQAYACAEYLAKGRRVAVSGRLVQEEWRGSDQKRRERYCVVGWVEFLDRPPAEDAEPATPEPEPEPHSEPELALVG